MPRRRKPGFIWIPPKRSTKWTCSIGGTEVRDYILSASFPRGLISEELVCEIELDNSAETYTGAFTYGDVIIFKMDFSDGSTKQFEGEIEEIIREDSNGMFKLRIKGAHYTSRLLDVMVTENYTGAFISDIRKDIIDKYLTGFTYNNILDSVGSEAQTEETEEILGGYGVQSGWIRDNAAGVGVVADVEFVNKPFLDCMIELDILANEDTFVDNDKDFHSFPRSSVTQNNDNEAVVWNDSLIQLRGLGTDSLEVRNKITIYGEAGGLPVISTSSDSSSQSTFRTKEKVITDTSITNEDQAISVVNAENFQLNNPVEEGSANCYFMPKLNPGDMVYVIYPPYKVHARFRVVKYVFKVPEEQTDVFFNQERSIPKLFKDRIVAKEKQETVVNENNMTQSYNFGSKIGFDINKIDDSASNSVEIVDGDLRMEGTVEKADMITNTKETPITVNSVEVRVIGETLTGNNYYISADGTNNWQRVDLSTDTIVTTPGTRLRLRIELTTTTARISSAVILYK